MDTTIPNKAMDLSSIAQRFGSGPNDVGGTAVQIAKLTSRISSLTGHLQNNPKDNHNMRGMKAMVEKRKKLLQYMYDNQRRQYEELKKELGIRHNPKKSSLTTKK